jgi:hypothetical protein
VDIAMANVKTEKNRGKCSEIVSSGLSLGMLENEWEEIELGRYDDDRIRHR